MPELPELTELLEAIEKSNEALEEIEGELTDLRVEISNLPHKYLPRDEAEVRADRVKTVGMVWLTVIFAVALFTAGMIIYVNDKSIAACVDDRTALRNVIEIAVADRQPLASSNAETAAAIELMNETRIRPLRERLLSLDGTHPEKC